MNKREEAYDDNSDPLVKRLRGFSPDHAALDRDALLFAAGRAAARPSRRWQALAGALAACQLISLTLLWPRALPREHSSPNSRASAADELVPKSLSVAEGESLDQLGVLHAAMLTDEDHMRSPLPKGPLITDEPPLRVFPVSLMSWN